MINMFSHMAYICHFVFMPCPEPPMCISSVGSFPVQSGGSLIFFQLLRCRNLALNRVFSYFLVVGMFLYLGGGWMPPCLYAPCMFVQPPIHLYAPTHLYAPLGVYTPHGPPCSLHFCMVLEHCMLWGGCFSA